MDETETLIATVEPHDSTDTVTWSSSNPAVATVDSNGLVTAKAPGTAAITAKAGACYGDICNVTVRGSGASEASVSGSVVSYGENDPVTIQLTADGAPEPASETIVTAGAQSGNKFTASYSLSAVAPGTYTMKVIKQNHVTREYSITVSTEAVTQDVAIWLTGDVTGDGKVDMKDWSRVRNHIKETNLLTDDYAIACADVINDGKIDMKDWSRVRGHINESNPIW